MTREHANSKTRNKHSHSTTISMVNQLDSSLVAMSWSLTRTNSDGDLTPEELPVEDGGRRDERGAAVNYGEGPGIDIDRYYAGCLKHK